MGAGGLWLILAAVGSQPQLAQPLYCSVNVTGTAVQHLVNGLFTYSK